VVGDHDRFVQGRVSDLGVVLAAEVVVQELVQVDWRRNETELSIYAVTRQRVRVRDRGKEQQSDENPASG
jgi:hypothetical protein